ncbi:MAG: lipopolysaccharide transport periplasmic protein LptA [Stenotrophomonas koreensis]
MNLPLHAKFALAGLAALLLPGLALARSSDRNQPMNLDSDRYDCNLADENGRCRFSGNVVIEQGTLHITAETADVYRSNGQPSRVVLSGSQVKLRQQMDDGTPMAATADSMDYNIANETIVLSGNYTVESPRGTNSGQRMTYNLATGNMNSGGDGSRVRTVLQPKQRSAPEAK